MPVLLFHLFPLKSDHLKCDTSHKDGCSHCHTMKPTICCNLHHPSEFSLYNSDIGLNKPQCNSKCSRILKYTRDNYDLTLQDALEDWQEEKTAMVYGWACLNNHGPLVIMLTYLLNQIVDCAHHQKLQSVQDLKQETGWTGTEKFRADIIMLVMQHTAPHPSPFVSTPLQNMPTLSTVDMPDTPTPSSSFTSSLPRPHVNPTPATTVKHRIKCGACGEEGHNGMVPCNSITQVTHCRYSSPQSGM